MSIPTSSMDCRGERIHAASRLEHGTLRFEAITATDAKYRGVGIIEGLIAIDDVPALAKISNVRAVFLVNKPELDSTIAIDPTVYTASKLVRSLRALNSATTSPGLDVVPGQVLNKLGTAFDQAVTQHRVDRINQIYDPSAPVNYDGNGISVGAMSDSYNTRATGPRADTGVANRDLPGPGNPINSQPVVVLQDDPVAASDEGRGMIEIIHKLLGRE